MYSYLGNSVERGDRRGNRFTRPTTRRSRRVNDGGGG